MRPALWTVPVVCCLWPAVASAQDGMRFVERTPQSRQTGARTLADAGNSSSVAWWAVPGISKHETAGYVGGGRLKGNNVFTKGTPVAAGQYPGGPDNTHGTFAWDFAGFHMRPGRVFLAPSADPAENGGPLYFNYRSEGPHVPDVFALRPFRKAVLEKREAKHPSEEEGHGGHGGEGGHGDGGNGHGEKPGEKPAGEPKH